MSELTISSERLTAFAAHLRAEERLSLIHI